MIIRAFLIGLSSAEADSLEFILDRIHVRSEVATTPAAAKTAIQNGGFDLAIIGYESEGCGLPFAVSVGTSAGLGEPLDCIIVADQMCPTLVRAAKDLGLLAVLVRPVAPRLLASAIATHIEKRLARGDPRPRAKAIA
jgi:DNA-binding NtrC family response regulator